MARTFSKARGGRLVEVDRDSRDEFLRTVRRALGRAPGAGPGPIPEATALSRDAVSVAERAEEVSRGAEANADELMSRLQDSAAEAGWTVTRCESPREAAQYVESVARDLGARSVVRSAHPVLDPLRLEGLLARSGIEVGLMAIDETDEVPPERQRQALRGRAIEADLGITGAEYAIADTGSCVLLAEKGVSRLVSLLPPAHVVVVKKGQVLPGLDELFTLRRHSFLQGSGGSYMNIITGPSRSADIEQTIVTGVHGPGDVHMVLLG